ncbi:MAG: TIGR03960 family B12-binding radical SAM protein [Candidatus Saganbacteria bacterium]|nr:TIGR03960 family B12-binding radical SAM protein [Candidatus Saganbacteria bacterium]
MTLKELLQNKILPNVRKPARYIGNELNSIHKDLNKVEVKVGLAYPDLYEIGMSNLGIQILYSILNSRDDVACERVFAPAPDLEDQLTTNNLQLTTLESMLPVSELDMIGFSLQHELNYTNLLTILNLAGIPAKSIDRTSDHPIVFAGGPCAFNPEPLANFIDFFCVGEGEEIILDVVNFYKENKGLSREEFLKKITSIEGIYVPSIGNKTKKRIIKDFNDSPYPTKPIIPFLEVVHDRAMVEIMRGCPNMCRFCQAAFIYRPVRAKKPEKVIELACNLMKETGWEEISLVSLSSSDYKDIEHVAKEVAKEGEGKKISISLPSMRLDSFSINLARETNRVRPTSVTLAPEAGSQRIRDHIGKGLTEENILEGVRVAFGSGIDKIKLYFMIGLPTEKEEDLAEIVELSRKILDVGKKTSRSPNRVHITVSISTFIPKPHTPFERERQIGIEETLEKHKFLKTNLRDRRIELRWHDAKASFLEGVFARGDKELGKVIETAYKLGTRLDAWSEYFKFDIWEKAFEETGIDPYLYLRKRDEDEELPWSKIDAKN